VEVKMKQVTRWSPDSCGCVLEYEWDDAVPATARTHTFKTVVKKCSSHSALTDKDIYNQVLSENTRKNKVFGIAQQFLPEIKSENYNWSFDDKRILKVGFIDIPVSGEQMNQIRNAIQQEIVVGAVEVI